MLLAATSLTPDRQTAPAPTYSGFKRQHATRNRKLHRRRLLLAKEMELRLPAPDRHPFRCRSDAAAAVAAAAAAASGREVFRFANSRTPGTARKSGSPTTHLQNKMENSANPLEMQHFCIDILDVEANM